MAKFDPWPVFFKREWGRNWPFLAGFAVTGILITKLTAGFTEEDLKNSKFVTSHPELVEPASLPNEQKAEEESEVEGLLPSVSFPERHVQTEEWKKEAQQFETHFSDMEMKIHRFPASLQCLYQRHILPVAVSIGIYHHNSSNLQEMEKVKHVAARRFISETGHTFAEMYAAVFSAIGITRSFYYVKVDIGDAEFADIMFIYGCFLLQYMLACTNHQKLPPVVGVLLPL
ncbi:hypothetical protein ACQ4PT_028867 [Festuca glaucescens]